MAAAAAKSASIPSDWEVGWAWYSSYPFVSCIIRHSSLRIGINGTRSQKYADLTAQWPSLVIPKEAIPPDNKDEIMRMAAASKTTCSIVRFYGTHELAVIPVGNFEYWPCNSDDGSPLLIAPKAVRGKGKSKKKAGASPEARLAKLERGIMRSGKPKRPSPFDKFKQGVKDAKRDLQQGPGMRGCSIEAYHSGRPAKEALLALRLKAAEDTDERRLVEDYFQPRLDDTEDDSEESEEEEEEEEEVEDSSDDEEEEEENGSGVAEAAAGKSMTESKRKGGSSKADAGAARKTLPKTSTQKKAPPKGSDSIGGGRSSAKARGKQGLPKPERGKQGLPKPELGAVGKQSGVQAKAKKAAAAAVPSTSPESDSEASVGDDSGNESDAAPSTGPGAGAKRARPGSAGAKGRGKGRDGGGGGTSKARQQGRSAKKARISSATGNAGISTSASGGLTRVHKIVRALHSAGSDEAVLAALKEAAAAWKELGMVTCVKGKLVEAVRGIGEPAGPGSGAAAGPMMDGEEDDRVGVRARALVAAWKQQAKQHKALKSNKPPRLPQSPAPAAAAAAAANSSKASAAATTANTAATGAGSAQPVPAAASKLIPSATSVQSVGALVSPAGAALQRQTSSSYTPQANGQLPGRSPIAASSSSVQSLLQAAADRQRKDKHKELGGAHGRASAFAGTAAKVSQAVAARGAVAPSASAGPAPPLPRNGRGRQGGGGEAPGADGRPSGEAVLAAAMQCASRAVRMNQRASHGGEQAGAEGDVAPSGVMERLVQGHSRGDVEYAAGLVAALAQLAGHGGGQQSNVSACKSAAAAAGPGVPAPGWSQETALRVVQAHAACALGTQRRGTGAGGGAGAAGSSYASAVRAWVTGAWRATTRLVVELHAASGGKSEAKGKGAGGVGVGVLGGNDLDRAARYWWEALVPRIPPAKP